MSLSGVVRRPTLAFMPLEDLPPDWWDRVEVMRKLSGELVAEAREIRIQCARLLERSERLRRYGRAPWWPGEGVEERRCPPG
jgi:hypothetical protein